VPARRRRELRFALGIPQAIIVSAAGYFFYLIRRVSRGNVVNSVIHGLVDFSILSGTAIIVTSAPTSVPWPRSSSISSWPFYCLSDDTTSSCLRRRHRRKPDEPVIGRSGCFAPRRQAAAWRGLANARGMRQVGHLAHDVS
jgi:hypothetical protein